MGFTSSNEKRVAKYVELRGSDLSQNLLGETEDNHENISLMIDRNLAKIRDPILGYYFKIGHGHFIPYPLEAIIPLNSVFRS
jgi:hypothetical protein